MNKELIEKIDKALKYAKEYSEYLEKKRNECHDECGIDYEDIIPYNSGAEKNVKNLEYIKEVLLKLDEENIAIDKKYFIMANIYLEISLWNRRITFNFYVEDDRWLYNNYIDSHSGITEWLNDFINELYKLYNGNSSYCYALGICSLNDYKRIIENENKDKYSSEKRYSVNEVVTTIKKLIEFFTDDKNEIRNAIIEDVEQRFKKLHNLVEKAGD